MYNYIRIKLRDVIHYQYRNFNDSWAKPPLLHWRGTIYPRKLWLKLFIHVINALFCETKFCKFIDPHFLNLPSMTFHFYPLGHQTVTPQNAIVRSVDQGGNYVLRKGQCNGIIFRCIFAWLRRSGTICLSSTWTKYIIFFRPNLIYHSLV